MRKGNSDAFAVDVASAKVGPFGPNGLRGFQTTEGIRKQGCRIPDRAGLGYLLGKSEIPEITRIELFCFDSLSPTSSSRRLDHEAIAGFR